MRRSFARLCLIATIAAIACAVRAEAEEKRGRKGRHEDARETTVVGCLEPGAAPNSFALRVAGTTGQGNDDDDDDGDSSFAPGTVPITLVGAARSAAPQYLWQVVRASGVVPPRARQARGGSPRLTVQHLRPVGGSCDAAQPLDGSGGSTPPAAPPAAPPASGTTNTTNNTTTNTSGSSGQSGVSGDAILDGLINFNIQQLLVSIQFVTNVQDTVINVTDVLNDFQIQLLIQALNSNPIAWLNATELSQALQQSGMLAPGETVVGATPATISDNQTLTSTLQERGILQRGERVVGVKGPRVYKMKH